GDRVFGSGPLPLSFDPARDRVSCRPPRVTGAIRLVSARCPWRSKGSFRTAGFREVSVHTVPTRRRFPSVDEAMQYARGPLPLRELMARLSHAEEEQAWAEIERALAQFGGPNGYASPCELLIGAGTK